MRSYKVGNVPGFPEYYITKNGKLYSRWSGKWKRKSSNRIKNNGYAIQTLHDRKGHKKTYGVHQLVAMVWVPNPDNKPCVCHKDNVRTHNHYKNLYWGTNRENTAQMVHDGRHYIPNLKISDKGIKSLVKDYLSKRYTLKQLKAKYGISVMTMYHYLDRLGIKRQYRTNNKLNETNNKETMENKMSIL